LPWTDKKGDEMSVIGPIGPVVGYLQTKVSLTSVESRFFESLLFEKLADPSIAVGVSVNYLWPAYCRIREIEKRHIKLMQGDLILLLAALNPRGEGFSVLLEDSDNWHVVKFPDSCFKVPSVDSFFIATKFILGIQRSSILQDEIEKEMKRKIQEAGQENLYGFQREGKGMIAVAARRTAERRVDRVKPIIAAFYPLIIQGFAEVIKKGSKQVNLDRGKNLGHWKKVT
jgi:hypothetical protein